MRWCYIYYVYTMSLIKVYAQSLWEGRPWGELSYVATGARVTLGDRTSGGWRSECDILKMILAVSPRPRWLRGTIDLWVFSTAFPYWFKVTMLGNYTASMQYEYSSWGTKSAWGKGKLTISDKNGILNTGDDIRFAVHAVYSNVIRFAEMLERHHRAIFKFFAIQCTYWVGPYFLGFM